MNEILQGVLVGILFVMQFFSTLGAHSLRDFSRSRLNRICQKKGRESRFGIILKRHEDALIATELLSLLLTITFVAVVIDWLNIGLPVESNFLGWLSWAAEYLVFGLIVAVTGVIIPWTISRVVGEAYLYRFWPLFSLLLKVFGPALVAAKKIDTFVHRLSGVSEPHEGDAATLTEEIRTVVDEGQREGILESEARTMIHRVMELQQEDVAAIMTPRTEMHCIGANSTLEEARLRLLEAGHSRVPVIGDTTDDIVGILYAKDLLRDLNSTNSRNTTLTKIVREPFYVPETTGIDKLLETMKRRRVHLAIVVDEYGGVAGLVTMEDVLEEIVGEIVDEYDMAVETGIIPISPGVNEVEARLHIDDLNEQFGYGLPEEGDFDTIGGFIFAELGRVPTISEVIQWKHLQITVIEADDRKIRKLRIKEDDTLAAQLAKEV